MTDEQRPATDLERAVHEFLRAGHPTVTLGRLRDQYTYAVVPITALNMLACAVDPERPAPRPFVAHDPAMKGGQATVNGTRLTVENLVEHVWSGWTEQQLRDGWDLTRGDILVACWFWANHGGRTWKRRWGSWSDEVYRARSAEDFAAVDWPPTMKDGAP